MQTTQTATQMEFETVEMMCRQAGCPSCTSHELVVMRVDAQWVFACCACDSVGFVQMDAAREKLN